MHTLVLPYFIDKETQRSNLIDHPYEADGLRSLHWEPISSLQGLLVALPAVQVPSPHPQMHCLTPCLPAGLESWGLIYFTASEQLLPHHRAGSTKDANLAECVRLISS